VTPDADVVEVVAPARRLLLGVHPLPDARFSGLRAQARTGEDSSARATNVPANHAPRLMFKAPAVPARSTARRRLPLRPSIGQDPGYSRWMRPAFGVLLLAAVTTSHGRHGVPAPRPGRRGVADPADCGGARNRRDEHGSAAHVVARGTILSWLDIQDTTAVLRYAERGSTGTWRRRGRSRRAPTGS
jgi:hypothetical protein